MVIGESAPVSRHGELKLIYIVTVRHIDTAQMYKNEGDVGKAVAASGIPRGEIFISLCRV